MAKPNSVAKSRRQIGVIATRLEGTDGVSLETKKWTDVLERLGYECFYLTGESDRSDGRQHLIPEVHFKHPEIERIYTVAFCERSRPPEISQAIHRMTEYLKQKIVDFVDGFGIDLLLLENVITIPLNLPLGLALTEFIAERSFPVIAHHHDFFWERKRFLVNCIWDYLNMAFPPHLPSIRHVVINSSASNQLSLRTGISGMIIPNVMDFDHPPPPPDEYTQHLCEDIGLEDWELFFLQPTRVVQRKGIEHAIELIHSLGFPARLIISHASGDEGHAYERRVRRFADTMNVRVNLLSDIIGPQRGRTADGRRIYSLADVYPHADLVTYPSTIEGFGNAFLEAVYFRRPLLVNNYSIFAIDIKPKGFRVIEFDDFISEETVEQARRVLGDQELAREMTEHNYALGRRHYSYAMLERRLETLLRDCFGEDR